MSINDQSHLNAAAAAAGKRVLLGMSGGVDSSVACFLLQEKGYQVVGLTLLTNPRSYEHLDDVSCIARQAGVELIFADVQDQFRKLIITDFISSYVHGRTPNPCVLCNPTIKFTVFAEAAEQHDCAYVATGHYADINRWPASSRLSLKRTDAGLKDQTYFMYRLSQEQLSKLLLPLAGWQKSEVRRKAEELGLSGHQGHKLAQKPDSQDNCFVPAAGYADYIKQQLTEHGPQEWLKMLQPGPVFDQQGREIGTHNGLIHYTPGQRKGFSVQTTQRLFVLAKDASRNALIVGEHDQVMRQTIRVVDLVWSGLDTITPGQRLQAKIRNSTAEKSCQVMPLADGSLAVTFDQPVAAPAPGQSCVFYEQDMIMAGGYIADSPVVKS